MIRKGRTGARKPKKLKIRSYIKKPTVKRICLLDGCKIEFITSRSIGKTAKYFCCDKHKFKHWKMHNVVVREGKKVFNRKIDATTK